MQTKPNKSEIMNCPRSSSCLIIFFFSLFHYFSCASIKEESWCSTQFQCGNITASFPFWGEDRPEPCGHPLLQLKCNKDNTSITISNQDYNVLHLNQISNTLRLARKDLQGSFCSASFMSITLPPNIFQISPTYETLTVFYLCKANLSYRSSYTCPNKGLISVYQSPDYKDLCEDFTVKVPKGFLADEKEFDLGDLDSVLKKGFEVELMIDEKPCQECSSSGRICGFDNTTQVCCNATTPRGGSKCILLHPPRVDANHKKCITPFSCGDQTYLLYPFWIDDREECGHPDFKLNCSEGSAELTISSVTFRILSANYVSGTITLARSDYIGNLCPSDPVNTPFNETVLSLAHDTDLLTLYYGCSNDFSLDISRSGYFGEIGCGDDENSYYVTRNLSSPLLGQFRSLSDRVRGECLRNVTIPASRQALTKVEESRNQNDLIEALDRGFELGVNQNCSRCIDYRGACGYNQSTSNFVCYCKDGSHNGICSSQDKGIGLACGMLGFIAIVGSLICKVLSSHKKKREISHHLNHHELKALIPLKHYTFTEVKKITKSFTDIIGKGGFGTVYKGILFDGRKVAVKILKDSKSNGEDFINEVASISQTSHVNIVSLFGFCYESSNRAIVYEFLENGSLDHFISNKNSLNLDMNTLYGIALGVARGIEYLHYGCKTRIVHFDIKPQNVLLDNNLCPKVSDFGLAKLCEKRESVMSLLDTRGTIGYIAPEVFSRMYGVISHKSDVYSYGMLILEMIGARNKEIEENTTSNTSSAYFPDWIYKNVENGEYRGILGDETSGEEKDIGRKMILVGLWCIQPCPLDRPPMNKVIEMLEGSLDTLQVPPKPLLGLPATIVSETVEESLESSNMSAPR